MNYDLASRKTHLSEADLKKKYRSLLGQMQSQAQRSGDAMKPQNFAWFHGNRAEVSVQARKECMVAINQGLERLK